MSKDRDRIVFRRSDGTWVNQRYDTHRASSLHETQGEAVETARENLVNQGGGELVVKGLDGKIRSKDTIPPGNESSYKDTEH